MVLNFNPLFTIFAYDATFNQLLLFIARMRGDSYLRPKKQVAILPELKSEVSVRRQVEREEQKLLK